MSYNNNFITPDIHGDLSVVFVAHLYEITRDSNFGNIVEIFVSSGYVSTLPELQKFLAHKITLVGWLARDAWLVQFENGIAVSGLF